ncbi:MAG: LemA family protein, partial [Mailhella sp.]|nr:LemA family protein [Mailhella sp.]
FFVAMYNGMVRGRNLAEEAWSGISVQLKRRHDLIPNLVNVVKGYAEHEKQVLEAVTMARAASMNLAKSTDVRAVGEAERGLSAALGRLFAVAENYPELKANENFLQLQHSLSDLENEIQMARRYYNGASRDQNNRIQQFPANLFAGGFGFKKFDYFELDNESERAVPNVTF